ncbi:MAG: hypothetical protein EA397_15345 [Deltaproteobacteria bacterium]|nr:MAG: hypothetical protein EA397_15345 [Deltaproteobacteria bacterium]
MNTSLRHLFGLFAAMLVAGCVDPMSAETAVPIDGTTYRISPPVVTEGSELTVDIMRDIRRCKQVFSNPDRYDANAFESHEDRLERCLPRVDRASGQVELSFRLAQRDNANRGLILPLQKDHVRVRHMEREVPHFELERYGRADAGQLFILLVDATHTMGLADSQGITRLQRVINAILGAKNTILAPGSAVAVLRYGTEISGTAGQPISEVVPVTTAAELKAELEAIKNPRGFTELYGAVSQAVGPLLDADTAISRFLSERDMQPTVVLLTDGFNNRHRRERCGDNAPKLADTLQNLRAARQKPPSQRPVLYTVGFGAPPFRPGWVAPKDDISVTPEQLCGEFVHNFIDGELDAVSIDNVSLLWLAEVGGGEGFIKPHVGQIREALADTAPQRFTWYRVKYRVDPFYHRSSFNSRIVLTQFVAADASVMIHPSPWFDVPTGLPTEEGAEEGARWVKPGDIRRATSFTVPLLGGFIVLGFLGSALFNTRRALFRRAKRSSKKKK